MVVVDFNHLLSHNAELLLVVIHEVVGGAVGDELPLLFFHFVKFVVVTVQTLVSFQQCLLKLENVFLLRFVLLLKFLALICLNSK